METTRPYRLSFDDTENYLLVRVRGDLARRTGEVHYLDAIAEHCIRTKCTAILIVIESPDPFAVWDTFAIAPKLASLAVACIKIAVVQETHATGDQLSLSIMIGNNCGLDVHVFDNIADAAAWTSNAATVG